MKIDNFFAELKRRNVYKVAVAYAVVAWLLIQAASILFPTFDAPALGHESFRRRYRPLFPRRASFVPGLSRSLRKESNGNLISTRANRVTARTGRRIVSVTVVLACDRRRFIYFSTSPL